MTHEYSGNRKKENIEEFVVNVLSDVFNKINIMNENTQMISALNFLFAVRNKLNVIRGIYVESTLEVKDNKLIFSLKYNGKEFDPQYVTESNRIYSNKGYKHITKTLKSSALLKYQYSYLNNKNNINAIFDLSDKEFTEHNNILGEDACVYKSALIDDESVEVIMGWKALSFIHLGLFKPNIEEEHLKEIGKPLVGFDPYIYDGMVSAFIDELIFNIYHHSHANDDKQFKFNITIDEEKVRIAVKVPLSIKLTNANIENRNFKAGTKEIVYYINRPTPT